jgi:hypothetical protein
MTQLAMLCEVTRLTPGPFYRAYGAVCPLSFILYATVYSVRQLAHAALVVKDVELNS